MHRLQPVPRIRKCAVHDCRQRIGQVTLTDCAAQRFRKVLRGHLGVIDIINHR